MMRGCVYCVLDLMTDHVLLDDDDGVDQQFSSTNPFAQNAAPAQGDWKARLGAFARKAGDTVKQHATTAAAVAQVKLTEAKGMSRFWTGYIAVTEARKLGPMHDILPINRWQFLRWTRSSRLVLTFIESLVWFYSEIK